jgi:hypothetical protein
MKALRIEIALEDLKLLAIPALLVFLGIVVVLYVRKSAPGLGLLKAGTVDGFADTDCDRCKKARPCGCPPPAAPAATAPCCGRPKPCGCPPNGLPNCPACPLPDPSKWVLKSTVPACPPLPDMSKYMLKTECPPLPDMSKYVLKSSVPKCPPCISTCSKPCKIGECPPCPRPRCPVVKCPEPKACPACPAASCAPCPEPNIQCKADYQNYNVRPMLASTNTFGF